MIAADFGFGQLLLAKNMNHRGFSLRDPWSLPIHEFLNILVDPVLRLVAKNPRAGWANAWI